MHGKLIEQHLLSLGTVALRIGRGVTKGQGGRAKPGAHRLQAVALTSKSANPSRGHLGLPHSIDQERADFLFRIRNKKLSYRTDSVQCIKRPFKVTQGHPLLCQATIICDFLLTLNSKN